VSVRTDTGPVTGSGRGAKGRPRTVARRRGAADREGDDRGLRRRASRSLWNACEALLAAGEPRALNRALDTLTEAFECDGVALHVRAPGGELEPWCARGAWRARSGDLRDCLSVPLMRLGERVGTLDLRARSGRTWTVGQLGLIRTAAGALGSALGARLELQRLRNQPGRDPVTGLPDARAFHARLDDELDRTRRHGVAVGIVTLDLDHFGALDARYGRPVADRVLAEVALTLRLALRESDVLARLGGDQFGVLLPEADLAPARRCAERMRRALEGRRFAGVGHLSASIGVAAAPRCGVDPLELLDVAERALTVAKKSGRRRVVSPDPARTH
jgi:diguanylate cyclase (GGDEF)-like protein